MSDNQENVIEIEEIIEDDAPIISFNVPKIKRLAKKALPSRLLVLLPSQPLWWP